MTKKLTSLGAAMAKKSAPVPEPKPEPAGEVRTMTLRLPHLVHDQLRELAFGERRSQHALLMEALNMLFANRGKPPIAPQA